MRVGKSNLTFVMFPLLAYSHQHEERHEHIGTSDENDWFQPLVGLLFVVLGLFVCLGAKGLVIDGERSPRAWWLGVPSLIVAYILEVIGIGLIFQGRPVP